ncbi:MAG: 6-carboxytetrahydropterin synthase [Armatimonadota bacterium]|nr:6-carboxytetrahydropterin synthase [Armatimonadota bacterium]
MTMFLRRRAQFSAGVSDGGGHNYLCELTVGGQIDPHSGMVVNIKDVDAVLKSQVLSVLGGTVLDRDVPAFRAAPPTPENVVRWIWDQCAPALPPSAPLTRVTLWATPTEWAEFSRPTPTGEDSMLTVTRAYDFSASHRLHSAHLSDAENAEIFGKCNWANGHGHNYEVEITLAGEPAPDTGRLGCPETLDRIVDEEVLKPFDHRHLNFDAPEFRDLNPTSENLTHVIWDKLARRLASEPMDGARLYKVAVRETARNYFEYYG